MKQSEFIRYNRCNVLKINKNTWMAKLVDAQDLKSC